ncbi:ABC transporter ATP-binding protein [Micrococcoides hystricis]|uniref:ABC transporter ATP-binding protein n=1 Tax=Micrococcoides hystricis TaxID=1572761 RepID=A0ABV6PAG5_9MICC
MTTPTAIEISHLTRTFGKTTAIDDLSVTVAKDSIVGLLGRNGAGKTTLMALITGQDRPSAGSIKVFGQSAVENPQVQEKISFIRDNQRYPEDFTPAKAFAAAKIFHPRWSQELAETMIDQFEIPVNTMIKKLSRGQISSVAFTIGLASRAPLTFLDEPYLGLDATNRNTLYQVLLDDYLQHPRTFIISTHLIDEIDKILEHVLVVDRGKLVLDDEVDAIRHRYQSVSGPAGIVAELTKDKTPLSTFTLGGLRSALVERSFDTNQVATAQHHGAEITTASLQDVVAALGVHESAAETGKTRGEARS